MKQSPALKTLRAEITAKLHIDLRKTPIRLNIEKDAVVMEGLVDSIAHKKRALLLAMALPGVEGVIDRLRVKPAKQMSDKEIRVHLVDALASEPTLAPYRLDISVKDAVVDLEGKVGSLSHKRLCGVLAWWVPGSMEVINSLEVDPPEVDSPDEICDAIRIALEKDSLVNEGSIAITATKDWTVTLEGAAFSEAEKNAALDDAWYVWGVNEVVNKLKVV